MGKDEYRNKLYKDYVTHLADIAKSPAVLEDIRKKFPIWRAHYGKHLSGKKGDGILEIGCGCGDFVYYLRESGYKNVTGVDISEEQVKAAERLGIPGIVQGDLRSILRERTGLYDMIIARDILEHFAKDEIIEIMRLIHDAISEGGRCIIQTVNGESPFGMGYRYGDFTHEICFTRSSLGSILDVSGFQSVESYSVPPVPGYSVVSTIRFFLWKCIEAALRGCQLVETGTGAGIFTRNLIAVAYK